MKISVIIPCYNQANFLPEALTSLIKQSYTNWEAVVIDDGSRDNVADVVRKTFDERIIYVRQQNKGLPAARNKGLSIISGDLIKFLDADDMLHPLTFEGQVEGLKKCNADISVSGYFAFKHPDISKGTTSSTELTMENPLHDFIYRWEHGLCIPIHCFMYKKWVVDSVGGFDASLLGREDWDFHVRTAMLLPKYIHDPSKFALYRVHNKSMCRNIDMTKSRMDVLEKLIGYSGITKEMRDFLVREMMDINPQYVIQEVQQDILSQHNLSTTTFVLCVKIDSQERLNNLDFCINFLQRHFVTNIVLMEEDADSKIKGRYHGITHIYTHKNNEVFHRTATINNAVKSYVHTPYFCNLDIDVYTQPENYVESVKLLSEFDVVYPYNGRFFDVPNIHSLNANFSPNSISRKEMGLINPNSYGGAVFFRTQSFIDGGMENERFVGWAPEDNERYIRFSKLGYKIKRLSTPLYHFSHPRGVNSNETNPYYNDGVDELNKISIMSKRQLEQYIKNTFTWVESR